RKVWLEDARKRADTSQVLATIERISSSYVVLHIKTRVSDPVGPIGIGILAAVDYEMEVEFCKLGSGWRRRAKGHHDSYPSYLFFDNRELINSYKANGDSALASLGLLGPGKENEWGWIGLSE